jgi:PIN domain
LCSLEEGPALKTHYVLIDYENVQPKNLSTLKEHPVKVMVFVGANQAKVPFDLAESLQALGGKAEYVKISASGRNALDFHIAYYLGRLVELAPKTAENEPSFYVISKDTGFDPLIRHLKSQNVVAERSRDLAELPFLKISAEKTDDDQKINYIVKNLVGRAQSRPRKRKTLANTINSLFKNLDPDESDRLVDLLIKRNRIEIKDGKVTYHLPKGP